MTGGSSYLVRVLVTTSDGRSANAELTINPTTSVQSAQIAITSSLKKVNFNSPLVLLASVYAAESQQMTWSINGATFPLSRITLTSVNQTFTTEEVKGTIVFPLRMQPNNLIPGRTYVFQLLSQSLQPPYSVAYGTISITINRPPTSGQVVVIPGNGSALQTVFTISSFGWTTDSTNLPLCKCNLMSKLIISTVIFPC